MSRRALVLASLLTCGGCTGLLVYEGAICALGIGTEVIKPEIRQCRIELGATPDLESKLQQCFDELSAEFGWTLQHDPSRDTAGLMIEAEYHDTTNDGGFTIRIETLRQPAFVALRSSADASQFAMIDRACGRLEYELTVHGIPWRMAWWCTRSQRSVLGP